jgi:2-dehydro-3-deoxygluconokinase
MTAASSLDGSPGAHGSLVTLGETMGLLVALEPGPLHRVPALRLGMAGAESNVAIGVRRLGVDATWIGRLGTDEIGDLIERELRAEDVRMLARRESAPTGIMLKTIRTSDLVQVTYYRSASAGSRLSPDDIDEDVVARASVLHVTGITPALGPGPAAAVRAAIESARAHGVIVSLDVNYRSALWAPDAAGRTLRDLARHADVLFATEDEAMLLAGAEGTGQKSADLARQLTRYGPPQVVIKRGRHGCVALIDEQVHECAALPVRAVDPVGAGDAFVAGYLADLIAGQPAATRLATANATGAFAVTVSGDWEGLPRRAELALLHATDNVVR